MEQLMELREEEKRFQKFFKDTGFCTDEYAITPEELEAKLLEADDPGLMPESQSVYSYESAITESYIFPAEQDVTAVQHLRFMPAVRHVSGFFELECVLSGTLDCYVGDQKLTLSEGDVLILAPNAIHSACTYREDGIMVNLLVKKNSFEEKFLGILPECDILKSFFVQALYSSPKTPWLLFRTKDPSFVQKHVIPILKECTEANRYGDAAKAALLSLFFVQLLREHEADVLIPTLKDSSVHRSTIHILDYLQNNLADVTLSKTASLFNYSERQIQRILLSATGMNFADTLKKMKMQRAETLLKRSPLTVSQIADYLGYYDASSFRHAFRNYYGISPRQYRAEHMTEENRTDSQLSETGTADTSGMKQAEC